MRSRTGVSTRAVVATYVEQVAAACEAALGDELAAVWTTGSLATGDFDAGRSDIDILVACRARLPRDAKESLAGSLVHRSLPCPARGLDLLVYRSSELESIPRSPRYEFSISSGVDWTDEVSWGDPYPGGLIDLAVARRLGVSVLGGGPRTSIGPIPDAWIDEELLNALRWHTERIHDPFHDPTGSNAVLNACRALCFLRQRELVSKSAGARWLLADRPTPIVAQARSGRESGESEPLDRGDVLAFVENVINDFEAGLAADSS